MAAFFRIVQERWAATAMSGEGARRFGGRWNPAGIAAVYLADSRALAALEILVHAPREALALEWRVIEVEVPDECIGNVPALPEDWKHQPSSAAARKLGAEWLMDRRAPALRLPSVIVPQEHTLLVNPAHPDFPRLRYGIPTPFRFDPRL